MASAGRSASKSALGCRANRNGVEATRERAGAGQSRCLCIRAFGTAVECRTGLPTYTLRASLSPRWPPDDAGRTFPGPRVSTLHRVSPGVHCAPGLFLSARVGASSTSSPIALWAARRFLGAPFRPTRRGLHRLLLLDSRAADHSHDWSAPCTQCGSNSSSACPSLEESGQIPSNSCSPSARSSSPHERVLFPRTPAR